MRDKSVLTEIWIYPIKSFPGIRVSQARVLQKGLEGDRRLILIDENNQFITQRDHSEMSLFDVSRGSHSLKVRHKMSGEALTIDFGFRPTINIQAIVWDDQVDVVELNPAYSKWFSVALK